MLPTKTFSDSDFSSTLGNYNETNFQKPQNSIIRPGKRLA